MLTFTSHARIWKCSAANREEIARAGTERRRNCKPAAPEQVARLCWTPSPFFQSRR